MSGKTDNGYVIGDPCEAVVGEFVWGPLRCRQTSVAIAIDGTWGTTHVVCAEHDLGRPTRSP